jgi:hypothetical protein
MGMKNWLALSNATTTVDTNFHTEDADGYEESNNQAIEYFRNQSIEAQEAYRQRLRDGEANAKLLTASSPPNSIIALAASLTEAELREHLTEAIEAYDHAFSALQIAGADVARATERSNAAKAEELSRFNLLDQRMTSWRVEQVRQNLSDPVPHDLLVERARRAELADVVQSTTAALTQLQQEWKERQAELEQADKNRRMAAIALITKHADSIATSITEQIDLLTEQRHQLQSIASTWVRIDAGSQPIPVSQIVRNALRLSVEEPASLPAYQATTREWFENLLTAPDAEAKQWTR